LALQLCPLPSRPLQTPLVALQPVPQVVKMSASSSQRWETLPAQLEPAPSHSTQRLPSLAQNEPSQAPLQHTLAPETVGAQAPEAHSAPLVQLCPADCRQVPFTSWLSDGHTHEPSVPQMRPLASQAGSQHRLVPVTSTLHAPDSHCAAVSQPVPARRRAVQPPLAVSQPLPQVSSVRLSAAQLRETPP
jgi:hypothetical protein